MSGYCDLRPSWHCHLCRVNKHSITETPGLLFASPNKRRGPADRRLHLKRSRFFVRALNETQLPENIKQSTIKTAYTTAENCRSWASFWTWGKTVQTTKNNADPSHWYRCGKAILILQNILHTKTCYGQQPYQSYALFSVSLFSVFLYVIWPSFLRAFDCCIVFTHCLIKLLISFSFGFV